MNVSFILASSLTYLMPISETSNEKVEIILPFFAGDDFIQDFLAGTLSRAKVRDQVNLGELTPGSGTHDAAAVRLGIWGIRSHSLLNRCIICETLVEVRRSNSSNGRVFSGFDG